MRIQEEFGTQTAGSTSVLNLATRSRPEGVSTPARRRGAGSALSCSTLAPLDTHETFSLAEDEEFRWGIRRRAIVRV